MTLTQQIITIGLCILGTMTTRFLPFIIFSENRKTPEFIQYWEISSFCRLWNAHHLLPAECRCSPWNARTS